MLLNILYFIFIIMFSSISFRILEEYYKNNGLYITEEDNPRILYNEHIPDVPIYKKYDFIHHMDIESGLYNNAQVYYPI